MRISGVLPISSSTESTTGGNVLELASSIDLGVLGLSGHCGYKTFKEVARVVGTSGRLRVILHRKYAGVRVLDAFTRTVVEVLMTELHTGWERVVVDDEAMILGRNLDAFGSHVLYGLVEATVSEL